LASPLAIASPPAGSSGRMLRSPAANTGSPSRSKAIMATMNSSALTIGSVV
jgi:hypothetical protein